MVAMLLSACHSQKPDDPLEPTDASTHYATLLQMQDIDDGITLCRIMNPWQQERVAIQYLLCETTASPENLTDHKLKEMEEHFGRFLVLDVPLQRQTLTASCHAWLLNELEATASIGVMCDAGYVQVPAIQRRLDAGSILDGGKSMAPNAEVIRAIGSDAIWISPYEATSQQIVSAQLPDIPIIYCADYMETGPLARAEWMRFYGRLVGKTDEADSLFNIVETNYRNLTCGNSGSGDLNNKPRVSVLPDLPYGATWYVAGGRSTLGQMYSDAGFHYPWTDDTHGGSLALSPEAVFDKAQDADIWLFKYNLTDHDMTLSELIGQNALYGQFHAAQTGDVFGCNTSVSDYFDATPFRPDLLLRELKMLRQGQTDSLIYFHRL